MKSAVIDFVFIAILLNQIMAAERPWQQLTMPTAREVAASFEHPPSEYAATVTWGWDGMMSEEVIARDLDTLHARGLRAVTIEAGYQMGNAPYLTDGWFRLVRFAAEEAYKRGMRVWIKDEGKSPSGFAGGRFSRERPDLRMQGLAVSERIEVSAGDKVVRTLSDEVVGVIAQNRRNGESRSVPLTDGEVRFTAPAEGEWQLLIVDHQFRTPATRAVNDPTRAKTVVNAMGDLINPEAGRQFIEWTHEQYKRHMGDLFGTAIMGFCGEKADFGHTPWTPGIVEEFQRRKGYDPQPYLAFFAHLGARGMPPVQMPEDARCAKADYWDVWSDLFADHFFSMQSEWAAANGLEYTTHLNNDHYMPGLIRSTGDYFKVMRQVQIPGIHVIWNQVWPGKVADFVKYASSAAHLYGRPRAGSESFAGYTPRPNLDQVRFGVNYQFVRGINLFEFMYQPSSAPRPPRAQPIPAPASEPAPPQPIRYLEEPGFTDIIAYVNRVQFLLTQGRPSASIAVYYPTTSLWLGDNEANKGAMTVARQLLENQRDFDFVDDNALASLLVPEGGGLRNLSGQVYRAVIIPSATAISRRALNRLETFAKAGGRVIFTGGEPTLAVGRSFRAAMPPADLSWAVHEAAPEVTPEVLNALAGFGSVALDHPAPAVKVMHRNLRDAEVYFIFNESEEKVSRRITLTGTGRVESWDARSGRIEVVVGAVRRGDSVTVPLDLAGHEARILVVRTGSAARLALR